MRRNAVGDMQDTQRIADRRRLFLQRLLDAAAGRFPGLIVPGRETALGLRVGLRSRVSPRSLRQGIAFVGNRCRIEASAEFHGEVVVADDVIVEIGRAHV